MKIRPETGPLIQEIKSVNEENEAPAQLPAEASKQAEPQFSWETAEHVEAKHQFFHMKEFVIINFQMKGYNKNTDVHYALSENELLVEIRDSSSRVHRVCKTLYREVDVSQSSIELLVDFVAVKLRKQDASVSWDQAGYDITNFSLPKRG